MTSTNETAPNQTLGEFVKEVEHSYRRVLSSDDYLLLRLDGRAFHSYTKHLTRPYDPYLSDAMGETLRLLCEQIAGVRVGYVQSDEISLLISAFTNVEVSPDYPEGIKQGELWMGGVEAKLLSLSASMATALFNDLREKQLTTLKLLEVGGETEKHNFHPSLAQFDARLWQFPGHSGGAELVRRYFLWRWKDCVKNSVTMLANTLYSPRELSGRNSDERREFILLRGENWDEVEDRFKYGQVCRRHELTGPITFTHKRTGELQTINATRHEWKLEAVPDFTQIWDRSSLPIK